jgi:Glyoxalase-like domain
VPEPKTVRNRVHIDLHVRAVADMLALAATVVDDTQPWTVMADPEGNEFCAFVRQPDALPDYRLYELVVNAADPSRAAMWWADVLGALADYDDASDSWGVSGVAHLPWELVFGAVPEPKTVKNRMHWDVVGDVEGLLDAGAQLLRAPDEEIDWHVLADPEGNEFCVFAPHE